MKIANYDEFIQVINSLFNPNEVSDFASFALELAKSKKLRNIKRNRYETELKKLKSDVIIHKQKLRMAQNIADKQQYGKNLKELNRVRRELIRKHKQADSVNLFNEMSENTKIYACCRHLLTKYLPQSLAEDLSRAAEINPDGSISVNSQIFKDSRLYQDAAHIKDYVVSYFENYPERIKGTRYFVGLHKKSPALPELLQEIDSYFEKLNSPSEKENNRIKKSHTGIEVVKTYPKQHLQMVRVTTKAGLNYEGNSMHHCVGSYASRVEKGETQIYSLRDMGEINQELIPHATVEFKNGKIAQIKGPHDSIVSCEYIDTVRDMLLTLINSSDFQDIIDNQDISVADKNNIGIFKDMSGKIHDLFDFEEQSAVFEAITITKEALTALPLNKMKIKNLTYRGLLTEDGLAKLLSLKGAEKLHFSSLEYEGEVFDCSSRSLTEIHLDMQAPNLKKIIIPPRAVYFSLNGKFDNLENITVPRGMKNISVRGNFPVLKKLPDGINNLELVGKFPNLQTIPEEVKILRINGNFPDLEHINTDKLIDLRIQCDNIPKNMNFISMPELKELSLYGNCVAVINKLPHAPLLEALNIGSGDYELSKQYSVLEDDFTAGYPHLKYITLNGTFPKIRKLDLSLNKELKEIETLGAKFENLEKIKFPPSLSTCVFDFASFPKLKELDYSKVNSKKFGIIESFDIGKLRFGHEAPKECSSKASVKGLSLSFARFESLDTIKFPTIVEDVNLQNFSGASNVKKFNFEELTNLKELNLTLAPFDEIPQIDLSLCKKLKTVSIDGNILNRTILPECIEDLSIISVSMEKEMPDVTLDSAAYKKIKRISCTGFLPDERILKPSVENLTIHANNQNLGHLKQINMGRYKYVDMQVSGSSLSKLEKIIFPQTFKKMSLGDTSDKFTELDFSNTVGEVRICRRGEPIEDKPQISYFKYIRNGIVQEEDNVGHLYDNFLMLSNEQMERIRHIKLGKGAFLHIFNEMPIASDLKIEVAYDMPENVVLRMREENPRITFNRERNSKTILFDYNDIVGKDRN